MRPSSSLAPEPRFRAELASAAAILSGVLFLTSFPPFGCALFGWLALVPLLLVRHGVDRRTLLFDGYLVAAVPVAGIAYNISVFHVGAFAVVTLAIPAAFAVAIVGADALERRVTSPALRLLVFPACAVAIEHVLRVVANSPVTIALSQASHPALIQSVDVFGPSIVTFLMILGNVTIERIVLAVAAYRRDGALRRTHLAPVLGSVALLVANLAYGLVALHAHGHSVPDLRIAAVQPAITSETYRERWFNPAAQSAIDARLDALLNDALATRPDLVFLSEGSDGRFSFRVDALRERMRGLARRTQRGLVVASPDMTPDGQELNAVFSVAPDGAVLGRSAKRILTPVGEEHVARDGERRVLPTNAGAVGAMVCFESCFPEVARELVRNGAELLFVTTSDAPFRNGSMSLLHTAFSVFRAIETRRYLVQAANTGPSLVIDPRGIPSAETPFLRSTVLTGRVQATRTRTIYTAIGDVFPLLVLVGLAIAVMRTTRVQAPRRHATGWLAAPPTVPHVLAASVLAVVVAAAGTVASITLSSATADEHGGIATSLRRFVTRPALDTASEIHRFVQTKTNTCGAAALAFALRFYDVNTSEDAVAAHVHLEKRGTNLMELARATAHFGMEAVGVRMNMSALALRNQPTVVRVAENHFVVVIETVDDRVLLFDPAHGLIRMPVSTFARAWDGTALTLRFPASSNPTDERPTPVDEARHRPDEAVG